MITHIIFDVDGVLIRKKRIFSQRLTKEYGVDPEKIQEFFSESFPACLVGKQDLKQALKEYVTDWGWQKSIDELLVYWFSAEQAIDTQVLQVVDTLHQKGMRCFVGTNNEKYRTAYLWNEVGFKSHFEGIFSSSALGYLKHDQGFWQHVIQQTRVDNPASVLVCDDDPKNVETAARCGLQAHLYTELAPFKTLLNNEDILLKITN